MNGTFSFLAQRAAEYSPVTRRSQFSKTAFMISRPVSCPAPVQIERRHERDAIITA